MHKLHFHKISDTEYRAILATQVGPKWVSGIYKVHSTPELSYRDPFHRWEAISPDGVTICTKFALTKAMLQCDHDIPNFVARVRGDQTAIILDPQRVMEVV